MSEETIKTDLDKATTEVARLETEIESKKAALEAKETENAGPKADFEAKKSSWESLNAIYEGMAEEKRKVDKAIEEFDDAESNRNRTIEDLDAATKALDTFQVELSEATAKRDKVKDMPNRKPIAESEQRTANSNLPGLKTDEETKRGVKVTDEGAVNSLILLISNLNDKWKEHNCAQDRGSEKCSQVGSALESEKGKLKTANETFIRTNSEWMEAKRKFDECTTKLNDLTKEIEEINTATLTEKTFTNAVNFVEAQLQITIDKEDPLKEKVGKAKTEKDNAQKIYDEKKQAKDNAPAMPEGLDAALASASNARVELSMAEAVFTPLKTAEDKLKEELKELEKSFEAEQLKVGALRNAYEKKTAEEPGIGSLKEILGGIFAALIGLIILVLLLVKFVIVPRIKKKRERKPAASNKDSAAASGGDASNVASQTPSASQVQPPAGQPAAPAPAQEPAKSEPAAAAVPAKEQEDTYVKPQPGNPVKAKDIPDQKAREKIIKASNPNTLVYFVTLGVTKLQDNINTYIFDTENANGVCKRLLENGCIAYCLNAIKFKCVCAEKLTGQEEAFQVKTKNPTPNEPYFSAPDSSVLSVQEEGRRTSAEQKEEKMLTTESMLATVAEKRKLGNEYRKKKAEYERKQGKRQGAGRSMAEDTTTEAREQIGRGIDNTVERLERCVSWIQEWQDEVKRDQKELNYFEGKQNSTRSQKERKRFRKHRQIMARKINRMSLEQQRKFFKDHGTFLQRCRATVAGFWSQVASAFAHSRRMWPLGEQLDWPYNEEVEQPECLITGVQPAKTTSSDEMPQSPQSPIRCEERPPANNEDNPSRASSGSDDVPSDKDRERSDKSSGKKKDKAKNGKKGKKDNNKEESNRSDKSDRSDSKPDEKSGEPQPPGHLYPNGDTKNGKAVQERIYLKGNAVPPPITRLTHDADNNLRKDKSGDELKNLYESMDSDYEANKKRGRNRKPIATQDEILAVTNQFKKSVEEKPKLIRLDKRAVHVVGDVHGSMDVLRRELAVLGPIGGELFMKSRIVFLGDFVDRGTRSIETGMMIMILHLRFPEQVTVLRGNHESYEINQHYGFKRECVNRLGKKDGIEAHFFFNYAFAFMPVACVADGTLMMHGGIPHTKLDSLEQINVDIPRFLWDPVKNELACGLLWNDPAFNLKGFKPNSRGTGCLFGEDAVLEFCAKHGIKLIIRAHQVVYNGFEFFAGLKMVTIFTCSTYDPDAPFPNRGAICRVSEDYVVSFIILVPADRIPSDLPEKRKKAKEEMVRQMAENAHNMMNFMTNVKDGSLVKDNNQPKEPKEGDASETETAGC